MSALLQQIQADKQRLRLALPPFDPEAAQAGQPYVFMRSQDCLRGVHFNECFRIEGRHPATVIWAGEWLVYDDECEMEQLYQDFKMWHEAAFKAVAA